ncbi:MAG: cohesin domain-containing protein [Candidatus Poribacteria bacterium]|nr:cohesin domain-containing protein [Candidatus Poribacteria bacterium]
MKNSKIFIVFVCLLTLIILENYQSVEAQQNLAQQAYAIFVQNCLNCHGEHGAYTEQLIIEHAALVAPGGAVIPRNPEASEFYQRLIETAPERRMPLNAPPLSQAAIDTIRDWIAVGAPDWRDTFESDVTFITPKKMLETIENHVNSLSPFDRTFARYFTLTHLYNAGETTEALLAYQRALSKLVNSLSWGRKISNPRPIDSEETIFYIDLRDYEWEIGTNRWTLIEAEYPYGIAFNTPTQTGLREKLTNLREAMDCEVPFVHVDWFLATASLPPLYHDILGLPETDRELETRLEVNVVENLRNAAGRRVWRAGFNESGVSNHNRVVERHESRYGAYWKSYDFAGSVGSQNIFTHPLSFTHDGGEIIFNLPNGLQAYLLVDAGGNRLNEAPISIVRNPAASDPTVRNGLSCIGCHTEGMKVFEDEVRGVVEQNPNPPFNKDRALRLYTDQATMDVLVAEDTQRYREALWEAGGVFGGIEPIQRFHEAFQGPVDASHAATAVGLETEAFLEKIRGNTSLQNLGLLVLENRTMKRDTWTTNFDDVIAALDTPESVLPPVVQRPERIPGAGVYIPDPNLRAAIAAFLGKAPDAPITAEEMAAANFGNFHLSESISDLTGLEYATTLVHFSFEGNQIPDLSPLADLKDLYTLYLSVSDLSLLTSRLAEARLTGLRSLGITGTNISDISPLAELAGLTELTSLRLTNNNISDISPLAGLTGLEILYLDGNNISDISPLAGLTKLFALGLDNNNILDLSPLSGLTELNTLGLNNNNISDISPLTELTKLWTLDLRVNNISDISPLRALREKGRNIHWGNNPGFREDGIPIDGSWLWVVVPQTGNWRNRDGLALASGNAVTELEIATSGATVGSSVGDHVWASHKITLDRHQRLGPQLAAIGMEGADSLGNIVYGFTFVDSPREQEATLFVPEGYAVKVWVNGVLLSHGWRIGGDRSGRVPTHVNFTPVTLKAGRNVLLFGSQGGNSGLPGFAPGTEYTASIRGVEYTFSHPTIYVGDTFTLDLSARNVIDLAGWQFDIAFDPEVLEAVEVSEGDFLKTGGGTTFFQRGTIDNTTGKITKLSSARLSEDGVSGVGTLLSVTFTAKTAGQTQLKLENFQLAAITGASIPVTLHEVIITVEGRLTTGDVNRDGQVSILDMVLVARHFGKTVPANSEVDMNGDGVINIQDLIIVAQHLGESTVSAAPSMIAEELNPAMVQAWIAQAQVENDGSIAFQQGIANLQRLLASLIPEETALLPNYPNPFNPETWIPYQLSEPAEVTFTIYAVNGTKVRTLALGLMPAGIYQSRSRAAYWDGKNNIGESVASGVYFYTLTAGEFTSTRKMLIRK